VSRHLALGLALAALPGCQHTSETGDLAKAGAVAVAVGGGTTAVVLSLSRVYDENARDEAGRLIPVARQPGSPPLEEAAAVAVGTVVATGLLASVAAIDSWMNAPREPSQSTSSTPTTPVEPAWAPAAPDPEPVGPAGDAPPEPTPPDAALDPNGEGVVVDP